MQNNKKKVAILMAIYKKDKLHWFKESVDSIKKQTYGFDNINIYLCIDGPISSNIIEYITYNYSMFKKIICNVKNIGLAKSLNNLIGILENEEYIFRMDTDDISMEKRIEIQVDYLNNNPEVDLLGGSIAEINEKNKVINVIHYPVNNKEILKCIYKASPIAHVTVCFRKRIFSVVKTYPTKYGSNEDIALWFLLIKQGIIINNIKQILVFVRVTKEYYKRRNIKKAFSEFIIYFKIVIYIKKNPLFLVYPFARLIFRLLPSKLTELGYRMNIRQKYRSV